MPQAFGPRPDRLPSPRGPAFAPSKVRPGQPAALSLRVAGPRPRPPSLLPPAAAQAGGGGGAAAVYAALHNTTSPHAAPLFVNLLHSALYAWARADPACGGGGGGGGAPAGGSGGSAAADVQGTCGT